MRWPIKKLADVAVIDRTSISPESIATGSLYVGLEHITGDGKFTNVESVASGELASSKFAFTSGHLLYGKLRPYLRKIARPSFDGICSTDILPIRTTKSLDLGYLFHLLRTQDMVGLATARATGANLPRLSPKTLADFDIPLPPLSEQKRIAAILDQADALRDKRRQAIAKLDELLQSVFLDMFGDPVTNPKGWEVKPLGELCDVRDGTHDSPKYVPEGKPLVTSKNLSGGIVDLCEVNFISEEDFNQINKRSKVDRGDILMPMIGTIGNPVLVDHEPDYAIKNVALIKFADTSPSREYTLTLLRSHYFSWITGKSNRGGTQKFIALKDIRGLPIPVAGIQEQNSYSEFATCLKSKQAIYEHSEHTADSLFACLQQRAFKGEV